MQVLLTPCLALSLLLLPAIVFAVDEIEFSIHQNEVTEAYEVKATLHSPLSLEKTWKTLTDYERMPLFIPQIKSCRILNKQDGMKWVFQEGEESHFFLITLEFRVLLQIKETAFHHIQFKDTSGEDFYLFQGEWELQSQTNGTKVIYHLEAKPKLDPFSFLTSYIVEDKVLSMLRAIHKEWERPPAYTL